MNKVHRSSCHITETVGIVGETKMNITSDDAVLHNIPQQLGITMETNDILVMMDGTQTRDFKCTVPLTPLFHPKPYVNVSANL